MLEHAITLLTKTFSYEIGLEIAASNHGNAAPVMNWQKIIVCCCCCTILCLISQFSKSEHKISNIEPTNTVQWSTIF